MDQEGDDHLDCGKIRPRGLCNGSLVRPYLLDGDVLQEVANLLVVRDLLLVLYNKLIMFGLFVV